MLLSNRLATRFAPWHVLRAIEDSDVLRTLEHHWNQQWGDWFDAAQFLQSPGNFRLWTGDGQAVAEFDLPGLTPDAIDISVHENRLKVEVRPVEAPPPAEAGFHLRECRPMTSREVRLPFAVDPQATVAEYQHGVLRVSVQQPASHRPTRVTVQG